MNMLLFLISYPITFIATEKLSWSFSMNGLSDWNGKVSIDAS